jgi:hypothetical protein
MLCTWGVLRVAIQIMTVCRQFMERESERNHEAKLQFMEHMREIIKRARVKGFHFPSILALCICRYIHLS